MFTKEQIDELKRLFPDVLQGEEAGVTYFLLPQIHLPDGCTPARTDALLCPSPRDGYSSRLFFAEQIQTSKALNWNASGVRILERNWNAFSWKLDAPNLRLVQMLSLHLKALV